MIFILGPADFFLATFLFSLNLFFVTAEFEDMLLKQFLVLSIEKIVESWRVMKVLSCSTVSPRAIVKYLPTEMEETFF